MPIVPDMAGKDLPGVFCMRTPDDATSLRDYIKQNGCRTAAVVGAGFIDLEVAENLMAQELSVTVADAASQIMPNAFDFEMAEYAKRKLKRQKTWLSPRYTKIRKNRSKTYPTLPRSEHARSRLYP